MWYVREALKIPLPELGELIFFLHASAYEHILDGR
jgi:hypothetical protein